MQSRNCLGWDQSQEGVSPRARVIRLIRPEDDASVREMVRTVMREFGVSGPGTAYVDPELDSMSAAYADLKNRYFVVFEDGVFAGCVGFGILAGSDGSICELRKMYLRAESRGRGLGEFLVRHCMSEARAAGFRKIYLETMNYMERANILYQRLGFQELSGPLGNTGHYNCDRWYVYDLIS